MSKIETNRKIDKHITNWNDIKIVLIEEVNVENKDQLTREEDKYIRQYFDDPKCLNSKKAFISDEEEKQYQQQYINENKQKGNNITLKTKKKYKKNNNKTNIEI